MLAAGAALAAGAVLAAGAALAAGTALAAAVSAAHAARTTPGRSRVTRTVGWTRASMGTPAKVWPDNRGKPVSCGMTPAIAPR